jgi:hypothetical protein
VISLINGAPFSKDIIRSLLDKGADPNIADDQGLGPFDEEIDDSEVVDLLNKAGKVSVRNLGGAICNMDLRSA